MAALTWLADVLRAAGLNVAEVPGWKTRCAWGNPVVMNAKGVLAHATVTRRTSGPAPGLNIIINGREGLAGPISQLHLGRDGKYSVVSAGVANHAGSGGLWGYSGNQYVIGIEAENDNGLETAKYGGPEPWPDVQYNAYVRGAAAILKHLGLPASRVGAHREWSTTGKSDPVGIDMNVFRSDVAKAMEGTYVDRGGDGEEEDMAVGDDIYKLLHDGKRPGDTQTAGGGVPIAWIVRKVGELQAAQALALRQLGVVLSEVDGVEEGIQQLGELVTSVQAGDPKAVAAALLATLPAPIAEAVANELHARTAS